jgi:lipid-A-disaccharide synthase
VPAIVAYRVDPVVRLLKPWIKAPSIVLTNLVLGEKPVPELIDAEGSPEALARETLALLAETPARAVQLAALQLLEERMALPGGARPSDKAAEIVLDLAEKGAGRRAGTISGEPK